MPQFILSLYFNLIFYTFVFLVFSVFLFVLKFNFNKNKAKQKIKNIIGFKKINYLGNKLN